MKAAFVKKQNDVKNIFRLYFKPSKRQRYLPGQYYYFTVGNSTKQFTISSSPTEDDFFITTKNNLSSEFKTDLFSLKKGEEIDIEGPNGVFFVDESLSGSHIFIAGGMGITPFRSIAKYLSDKKIKNKIKLIYSSSDRFVFKDMFKEAILVSSRIDKKLLERHLDKSATYWVCGPPTMVDDVEDILMKLKIRQDKILSEKFTGY